MVDSSKQILDPRSAGHVLRYHTWPHLRPQSVAEHSWQLVRILVQIWPLVPQEYIIEVLFHDIGERGTGDMPYPTKANDPELKTRMDIAEADVRRRMAKEWQSLVLGQAPLSEGAKIIVKMCEFIEMWEWALDELALGNKNAALVEQRCRDGIMQCYRKINFNRYDHVAKSTLEYVRRRIQHHDTVCNS